MPWIGPGLLPQRRLEADGALVERCFAREAPGLEREIGPIGGLRTFRRGPDRLPDSTYKGLVIDRRGRPLAVILCSAPGGPKLVEVAVTKAADVKTLLGEVLGSVVVDPIARGNLDGMSYAIHPYRPAIESGIGWRFRRRGVARAAHEWLLGALRASRAGLETIDAGPAFRRALIALQAQRDLPSRIRTAAAMAEDRLERGRWHPFHVLDHNDIWLGNMLQSARVADRPPPPFPFILIDWAGANLCGFGVYDCLRLAESLRVPIGILRRWLHAHSQILACEPVDLAGHFLAGLGHLSLNLNWMPEKRFHALAVECWATLERAVGELQ